MTSKRSNFKWSINEILSLQREYELLELTVQEIAVKHERSVNAIVSKLENEGFIDSRTNARGIEPPTTFYKLRQAIRRHI
jgi:hypothetical protein